jgi:hypothetical protein
VHQYIRFETGGEAGVLVEVDREETGADPTGPVKVGLGDRVRDTVAAAQSTLEDALVTLIRTNARLFVDAVHGLERRPAEMELSFGVKATGELGNLAIAKAGGEANYTVRLLWKDE